MLKQSKQRTATQRLHARVSTQLIGLRKPVTEHKFHPKRRWRFDYAWVDLKIALEIHGGTYTHGRHVQGTGFANDREKMNEAQLLGWIVIEAASDNVHKIRGWLEQAMRVRIDEKNA